MTSKSKKIIAVVKADAYGHGAVETAKKLLSEGCDAFAVSCEEEAIELRKANVKSEILILGYVANVNLLKDYDLATVVYDETSFGKIRGTGISAYLKIDTGMNRLGFNPDNHVVDNLKDLNLRGILTHFAVADSIRKDDDLFTEMQINKFSEVVERIRRNLGVRIPAYCSNSASVIRFGDIFDGARVGIALYGINPSKDVSLNELKPAMSVKSYISSVKTINMGQSVSYGRSFTANKKMKIAVVTIGYADGYMRSLGNRGVMLINGHYVPVIGVVTMDQSIVDVSNIDCAPGDEVTVFGNGLTVESVAEKANTIAYEIVCGISKRVPRIYLNA